MRTAAVPRHKPTSVAPSHLLRSVHDDTAKLASKAFVDALGQVEGALGRPYFAEDGFILYQADCLTSLKGLEAAGVEVPLTVTSPPYNIGKAYEKPLPLKDYVAWCGQWMSAIHGVSTKDGALWLNLGYVPVPTRGKAVPLAYLLWDKSPFFLNQEVVWHYGAGVSAKRSFCPRNEKWLFFVKTEDDYAFNLDAVRDPDVKYPNQKKNGKLRCNPLGKNPSDVWAFPKVTTGKDRSSRERTAHPAQFPLAVIDRIIKVSSNEGDLVMDPFSGSGSTGIAAVGNGRVYLGFEISEEYCALAVERFNRYRRERSQKTAQASLL